MGSQADHSTYFHPLSLLLMHVCVSPGHFSSSSGPHLCLGPPSTTASDRWKGDNPLHPAERQLQLHQGKGESASSRPHLSVGMIFVVWEVVHTCQSWISINYLYILVENLFFLFSSSFSVNNVSFLFVCFFLFVPFFCILKAFCRMAIDYGMITRQKDMVMTSRSFYIAANWGKRLAEHQVGIKFARMRIAWYYCIRYLWCDNTVLH